MLDVSVIARERRGEPGQEYRATIVNIRWGRISDYDIRLVAPAGEILARSTLYEHPRWAEPVAGFVARCLSTALRATALPSVDSYRQLDVIIRVNRRELYAFECDISRGQARLHGTVLRDFGESGDLPHPFEVAAWAAALRGFGQFDVPPMPLPLSVPSYRDGQVCYCRTSDLPAEALEAYDRQRAGSTCPLVPGVPDAVYVWDMLAFLGA